MIVVIFSVVINFSEIKISFSAKNQNGRGFETTYIKRSDEIKIIPYAYFKPQCIAKFRTIITKYTKTK